MTNTQIRLKSTPQNEPAEEHFEVTSASIPQTKEGMVLCQTLYLSLDPYMRSQIAGRHTSGAVLPGDVLKGETVSRVIESKHADFAPGDLVRCMGGWQQYSAHPVEAVFKISPEIKQSSHALSTLGMPGLTAYAGLVLKAQVKSGDVVVVPAATGAVGSVVGQLAKIKGCTVIGIAGSDDKCRYAIDELGYDYCINRKTQDLSKAIQTHCPQGIDIYFDLVGGEMLDIASANLAIGARVVLCGLMAEYNSPDRKGGPAPGLWIKARASVFGLVVYDFEGQREAFITQCSQYVQQGRLKVLEDVTSGIENAPSAFCRLMRGENTGKVVVKV